LRRAVGQELDGVRAFRRIGQVADAEGVPELRRAEIGN
jgi:hypothetical protein